MGFLPSLSRYDVNHCIIVLTIVCVIGTVFAFASLFIVSSIQKSRSEKKNKTPNSPTAPIPPVSVTVSSTDK
eukprot:PDM77226.1 hypothetical protein PRIPAC_43138 [Pristionchus pacificus]